MKEKKNTITSWLILLLGILICIYAFNVFTAKNILFIGSTEDYQNLLDVYTENKEDLTDISYSNLMSFLESDKTDEHEYSLTFKCLDFSLTLLYNASLHNISSGITLLDYHESTSHCISCFNTTDVGLVFIEPQTDEDITYSIQILNHYLSSTIYGISTYWN